MHAELAHRLLVGGVGLHDVGQPAGQRLDGAGVGVDAEHLGAPGHQLQGEGLAESAEADHGDGALGAGVLLPSQ